MRSPLFGALVMASCSFAVGCSSSASPTNAAGMNDASVSNHDGAANDAITTSIDSSTDARTSTEADAASDSGPAPLLDAGVGHAVFLQSNEHWYRAAITPNAAPEDLSGALDSVSMGDDDYVNVSTTGEHYVLVTGRFACESGECLATASGDLSNAALVVVNGMTIDASARAAIGSSGNLIVFPASGGPHSMDLYATTKTNGAWSTPTLLTMTSAQDFNHDPFIHRDETTIVFECSSSPYQTAGAQVCEMNADGSNLRVVVSPTDGPFGTDANETHTPSYALDRSYVFEADWDTASTMNETVWNRSGTMTPTRISGSTYNDDNSPCVLADGRILSLWLGRAGNTNQYHELKVMNGDGTNPQMIVINTDIVDVGIGCGE